MAVGLSSSTRAHAAEPALRRRPSASSAVADAPVARRLEKGLRFGSRCAAAALEASVATHAREAACAGPSGEGTGAAPPNGEASMSSADDDKRAAPRWPLPNSPLAPSLTPCRAAEAATSSLSLETSGVLRLRGLCGATSSAKLTPSLGLAERAPACVGRSPDRILSLSPTLLGESNAGGAEHIGSANGVEGALAGGEEEEEEKFSAASNWRLRCWLDEREA